MVILYNSYDVKEILYYSSLKQWYVTFMSVAPVIMLLNKKYQ